MNNCSDNDQSGRFPTDNYGGEGLTDWIINLLQRRVDPAEKWSNG